MRLYSYWRSTSAYRVRIALHLKGVAFETVPVDLTQGAQRDADYVTLNPIAAVPTLVLGDGTTLTQSMAILEWLEARHPVPPLLPAAPEAAAQVRAAALVLATDVHPVNNLKVVQKLQEMGHSQGAVTIWMRDWMGRGLAAYQAMISDTDPFSLGETPSLADICLVAQMYNAHRWQVDLAPFERLTEIERRCLALPAFDAARPENQPEAPR